MQRLRHELGPEVVDNTNFHVVITVPAIWRDTAIARTVNALKRAWGTNSKPSTWKVTTLTEPEAAAICVLQQMPKHEMKEDDCIMVVDAGGGTVDLITYRIDGLTPCLRVEEAVPGAGGACGAAFLNERFERFLLTTIGQEDGFEQELVEGALRKWDQVCDLSLECLSRRLQSPEVHYITAMTACLADLRLHLANQETLQHGGYSGRKFCL